jgi:hypothetical protein
MADPREALSMFRVKQRQADFIPGSADCVLLADKSGSMRKSAFYEMDLVIPDFRARNPGLRVFVFHADVVEVLFQNWQTSVQYTSPDSGVTNEDWDYMHRTGRALGGNSTALGAALESIGSLMPRKTIILSDGGACDKKRALRAADALTGEIDCYFFSAATEAVHLEDPDFLRQLARRGRGRFTEIHDREQLRSELAASGAAAPQRIVREVRLPDVWIRER